MSTDNPVCVADVMYIEAAIPELVTTLYATCTKDSQVFIAHGRNRQAEDKFMHQCKNLFQIAAVGKDQLDAVYQTGDVDVILLRRL